MKAINWRWPQTPRNGMVPWWEIGRRLPALPLVTGGRLLLSVAAWWCQLSLSAGIDQWRETR